MPPPPPPPRAAPPPARTPPPPLTPPPAGRAKPAVGRTKGAGPAFGNSPKPAVPPLAFTEGRSGNGTGMTSRGPLGVTTVVSPTDGPVTSEEVVVVLAGDCKVLVACVPAFGSSPKV